MTTLTAPVRTSAPTAGTARSVLASTSAELLRLGRWPALWVTIVVELLLNVLFGYVFNLVSYRSGGGMADGVPREVLLDRMLPVAIPDTAVEGMPMFAGALVMILGALAAGSGYGWGTVKTVALQGPGRLASLTGTVVALGAAVVGVVTVLFASDLVASVAIATSESQAIVWPSVGELALSYAGGLLVMGMWTYAGVLVGTLARSPALSVGLGLVWVLAIENLLRGVGEIWSPLSQVTDVLPGTAAGSLAGALGATPVSEPGGTPGVLTTLGGGAATALLAAYAVGFVVVTAVLVRRRDIS